MSDTEKIMVPAYVAIIMEHSGYGARPLLSGIFTPSGDNNMDVTTLSQAGPHNNLYVFTKKLPNIPISFEKASQFYIETVKGAVLRHEERSKKVCPQLPRLPLVVLTGPEFINQAVFRTLMTADTVNHCMSICPNVGEETPLFSATGDISPAAAAPGSASIPSPKDAVPVIPPSARTIATESPLAPTTSQGVDQVDPFVFALNQSGLGMIPIGAEVSVVQNEIGEPQVEIEVQHQEDDRVAEEALQQATSLSPQEQNNPAVQCMMTSIKHLRKSSREKDKQIMGLTKLTMALEMKLQTFQESSAEDIAKGLLPKVQRAVTETQKGVVKDVKEDIENLKNFVVDKMESASGPESDGVKATLSRLAGNVAELHLVSQDIMKVAMVIDKKLTASGIIVKTDPRTQVNMPEVLLQINDKVDGSSFPLPSPPTLPNTSSSSSASQILSSSTAKVSRSVGLKRPVLSTPLHKSPTALSSPSPSTTPSKRVRWDVSMIDTISSNSKPQSTTASMGSAKSVLPRSLTFNSTLGDTPASNPALWKDMLAAQDTFPGFETYSIDQINQRLQKYQGGAILKKQGQ